MTKITFIGAGNMAYSLIGGLIKQGFAAENITAADPYLPSLEKVATLGVNTTQDNTEAVANADAVVLAIKPQVMQSIVEPLKDILAQKQPLLISIAAGIEIGSLSQWAGDLAIVRCMPNTPSLVQLGASGLFANAKTTAEQKTLAQQILEAVGIVVWLDNEDQIDAVTAVSGSGPAYYFLFMEAMQAAAEAQGLSSEVARKLTLQTALGAATMASNSEDPASQLRKNVTSPGGTTEQAILTFEEGQLRALVDKAMVACAEHSKVLAKQLGGN